MITKAAILMQDGRLLTLPRPARHHDLIWYAIHVLGYESPVAGDEVQGFEVKLPGNRYHQFCYREPARRIAEENNQLLARAIDSPELFSEDVWEGSFDREAWLENNTWNLSTDCLPDIGSPVWYFDAAVGVFAGEFLGYNKRFDAHLFGGEHGTVDAGYWMPKTDIKPDAPWVNIYEESSIISE